jgi:hypothetical protein
VQATLCEVDNRGSGSWVAALVLWNSHVQIAAGNGEQVLSRDVRRLAHNMNFARLLTWYHTGALLIPSSCQDLPTRPGPVYYWQC